VPSGLNEGVLEDKIRIQAMHLNNSAFVWVAVQGNSGNGLSMGSLAAAFPSYAASSISPAGSSSSGQGASMGVVTELLGGSKCEASSQLAMHLCTRLKMPVFASINVPLDDLLLRAYIEKRVLKEFVGQQGQASQ